MGLFDFDAANKEPKKDLLALLKRANSLCIREEYDRALEIYEAILEDDDECMEAYLGILRVHSEDYTIFEGEKIEKDIRIINKMFDDIEDEDYLDYLKKRKKALANAQEEKKEEPKVVEFKQPETTLSEWDDDFIQGRNAARKVAFISGRDVDTQAQKEAERLLNPYIKAGFPSAFAYMIISHQYSERRDWIQRAKSVFKTVDPNNRFLVYIFLKSAEQKLRNEDYEGYEQEMEEIAKSGYSYAYYLIGDEFTAYPVYDGYDNAHFATKAVKYLISFLESDPKRCLLCNDQCLWEEQYTQVSDYYKIAERIALTYDYLDYVYNPQKDYANEVKKWKRIAKLMKVGRTYKEALEEYKKNPEENVRLSENDEDYRMAMSIYNSVGYGSDLKDHQKEKIMELLDPYSDAGFALATCVIADVESPFLPSLLYSLKAQKQLGPFDPKNNLHLFVYDTLITHFDIEKKDAATCYRYYQEMADKGYNYAYVRMGQSASSMLKGVARYEKQIEYYTAYLKLPYKNEYLGYHPIKLETTDDRKASLFVDIAGSIANAYDNLLGYYINKSDKQKCKELMEKWQRVEEDIENGADYISAMKKEGVYPK